MVIIHNEKKTYSPPPNATFSAETLRSGCYNYDAVQFWTGSLVSTKMDSIWIYLTIDK